MSKNQMGPRTKRSTPATSVQDTMQTAKDTRVKLTWRTTPELRRKLKHVSADLDRTINDIISEAVEGYLETLEKPARRSRKAT